MVQVSVEMRFVIVALVLFLGVALNRFSRWLKMPILICFLGIGVLGGQYGLKIFRAGSWDALQLYGEVALCFIIFSGGLQTSFRAVKSVFVTGTILATVGVVLTALLTGVAVYYITNGFDLFINQPFPAALLAGSVFASTDAAAVFAILRGQKAAINPKLQNLLEYESGSNDPAAFLMTSVMIGVVCGTGGTRFWSITETVAGGIAWGLGMGTAVGVLIGILGQWFYNWIQKFLEYNGLRMVVAIGIVLFCFGITTGLLKANALMACYVAGITMGNLRFNYKQTLIKFHEGVSWLMQILLFTALGSFFDFRMLGNLRNMLGAVLVSLTLMFVARPLVVMLCMIGSPFSMKERLFTSWVGIRGSAPIMLAAMVVAETKNLALGVPVENFFYMVFTVVLFSILLQGSSLMWVAKKLGLVLPYEEKEETPLEYDERSDGREMYQFHVASGNPLAGRSVREMELEAGMILLMIQRRGTFLQPKPEVVLQVGDTLSFLGERQTMRSLHQLYFAEEEYVSSKTFAQLWQEFSRKYKPLPQQLLRERRASRKK